MRQTMEQLNNSRNGSGLTRSRYPSSKPQIIPPFSLFWVDMLHDYLMLRPDSQFVRSYLPGMQGVLAWYLNRIDPQTGLLGQTPYWNFVDWTKAWPWSNALQTGGVSPIADSGQSVITALQLAYTLEHARLICTTFGQQEQAKHYANQAKSLKTAALKWG